MSDPRRHLPSVDGLLESEPFRTLLESYPRSRVLAAVRTELEQARADGHLPEDPEAVAAPSRWAAAVREALEMADRPSLRRVVNATGVLLHTNLGRAPLADEARRAMEEVTLGYGNLEFELETGVRGSRYDHCADLLSELTGAEAALVVNNCAAGLMLALNTLGRDAGTVVSRGELVEIGGGFRIPEILERSGTRLVEVGSTNRTRASDYSEALGGEVAVLLKVHRSNFRIRGFTEEAELQELVPIARGADLPLIFDLGSGLLADPESLGLPYEPRPAEAVEAGADLVIFSGDKLLGGPQAGLVVGRSELIARLRSNPMCRALRVDKGTLAALEATLRLYRDPDTARSAIPILRMLSTEVDTLEARAEALVARWASRGVKGARSVPGRATVGGGTYPDVTVPSWTVRLGAQALGGHSPTEASRLLRTGTPPLVARIEEDEVVLDLRTLHPEEDEAVARRIQEVAGVGENTP